MKTTILIVSHQKDYQWLSYCLRSIAKYASGFDEIRLAIPYTDSGPLTYDVLRQYSGSIPLHVSLHDQWPENGMLFHEWLIIDADELCPEADFIAHIDSDCFFTEPVTPGDYFVDGKPVLLYGEYEWLAKRFSTPALLFWRDVTQKALGGGVVYEFMRRHPAVHYRKTYRTTRDAIERHTGKDAASYIRSCQGVWPHGFAEFPTLGEVAWRHFHDDYHWIDHANGRPHDKLIQFWGHAAPELPQKIWMNDEFVEIVPMDIFKKHL